MRAHHDDPGVDSAGSDGLEAGDLEPDGLELTVRCDDGLATLRVQAAVFDCDGVIMDSESPWLGLIQQWLDTHAPDQDLRAEIFHGSSVTDTARRLTAALDSDSATNVDPDDLATALAMRYSAMLSMGVEPMPGAVSAIKSLSEQIPVGLASNGRRADVEQMLAGIGLLEAIGPLLAIEDVAAGKPSPDLYLAAVERLGLPAESTIAFEDSPLGAHAAMRAGLIVVGVHPNLDLELPCHYRISSLADVAVNEIVGAEGGAALQGSQPG